MVPPLVSMAQDSRALLEHMGTRAAEKGLIKGLIPRGHTAKPKLGPAAPLPPAFILLQEPWQGCSTECFFPHFPPAPLV